VLGDDTLAGVQRKQAQYEAGRTLDGLRVRPPARRRLVRGIRLAQDARIRAGHHRARQYRELERSPATRCGLAARGDRRLPRPVRFLPLAPGFPDVFRLPSRGRPDEWQAGWSGGFDVVLGTRHGSGSSCRSWSFLLSVTLKIA